MAVIVHLSVEITRRKRVHIIEDEKGDHLRTFRTAAEVFDWIRQEGYTRANLALPTGTLELELGEFLPW